MRNTIGILEGDRVKIARQFLQQNSIYTGDVPFWKGTVQSFSFLSGHRVANVQWDHIPGLSSWSVQHLVRANRLHLELA